MIRNLTLALWAGALLPFIALAESAFAADSPHRIEITAKRFQYLPNEITVKQGELVDLVLTSADVAHGLQVSALHIDVKVEAGSSAEVQFRPKAKGDFSGHCTTFCGPGHGSMTFKIHVIP